MMHMEFKKFPDVSAPALEVLDEMEQTIKDGGFFWDSDGRDMEVSIEAVNKAREIVKQHATAGFDDIHISEWDGVFIHMSWHDSCVGPQWNTIIEIANDGSFRKYLTFQRHVWETKEEQTQFYIEKARTYGLPDDACLKEAGDYEGKIQG